MDPLTLEELPASVLPQLAAIKWLDGDGPQDRAFVRKVVRAGFPASPYYGRYLVEGDQLLAKVETLHLDYVGPNGPEKVLGISDVATRPDALGRGFARRILTAIHRDERADGMRWSFLWTRRSWGAHGLYLKLGYRDVFSPSSALTTVPRNAPTVDGPYRWRRAKVSDAAILERLLHRATRRRLGFVPRFPGSFRLKHAVGWRPLTSHRLLYENATPVGYAYVTTDPQSVAAQEIVVSHAGHAAPMIRALRWEARGRWLTLGQTTFVNDHAALLTAGGFARYETNHATLMAASLDPARRLDGRMGPLATCRDPRFVCHRGDVF